MDQAHFMAYRDLHREVRQLKRQLQSFEELMYSPRGQRFTSIPGATSGKGYTMADVVANHMELEKTFKDKANELAQELVDLEKAVESLESTLERSIMRYRYFDGMSWHKISEKTHISEPQLYRYHSSALRNLADYQPITT